MRLLGLVLALLALDAQAAALTTPAIAGVVKAGTPIEIMGQSFTGTEGPVALPDGSVLFTENRAARVTRIALDGSVSAYLTNPAGPNALALNAQGGVVATLTAQPGVAIIYPPERAAILVDEANGKPLNRPNDLVIDAHGGVCISPIRADGGSRDSPRSPPLSTISARARSCALLTPVSVCQTAFSSVRMRRFFTSRIPLASTCLHTMSLRRVS